MSGKERVDEICVRMFLKRLAGGVRAYLFLKNRREGRTLPALAIVALLFFAGCGSDEQAAPGGMIRFSAVAAKAADQTQFLLGRLNQAAVQFPAKKLLAQLQPGQRFGQIDIPRIGVREWIVQGSSKEILERGAGHIEGTLLPGLGGNFAVAGDRVLYTAPFLRLDQVEIGDDVLVHMPYGDFVYRIETITHVDPANVSVLNSKGYDSLMLSTCDPVWDLQTRIIVSARLTDMTPRA